MKTNGDILVGKSIILYDGVCGFCDHTIQFILQHKPHPFIRFVPYQSELGEQICFRFDIVDMDSIVLIENQKYYNKSTAVLRIAGKLQSRWNWLQYLQFVPKLIRDYFYDLIAKNRYHILGKTNQCRIPTPEERSFFIEN